MKITILDKDTNDDEIIIKCYLQDEYVTSFINHLKNRNKFIFLKNSKYDIVNQNDVYYFESVEDKTFAYTENQVYETKERIYKLENRLSSSNFFRASKGVLVNLNKVVSISPVISGRLEALLANGYKIGISRKYVNHFKEIISI